MKPYYWKKKELVKKQKKQNNQKYIIINYQKNINQAFTQKNNIQCKNN